MCRVREFEMGPCCVGVAAEFDCVCAQVWGDAEWTSQLSWAFRRYECDFYEIDGHPLTFIIAVIRLHLLQRSTAIVSGLPLVVSELILAVIRVHLL